MRAEGKGRPAQHDADQRQAEWDEKRGRQRGGDERERRIETYHQVDQPDVIGLPDRSKRVHDQAALFVLFWAKREQVPDAGSEISASEHCISDQ